MRTEAIKKIGQAKKCDLTVSRRGTFQLHSHSSSCIYNAYFNSAVVESAAQYASFFVSYPDTDRKILIFQFLQRPPIVEIYCTCDKT
jgi:hypothetical protein